MATYVILSKVSPTAFQNPKDFQGMAKKVAEHIKKECSGITWKESYATFGRFDVADIVESDDPDQVTKAAMIIRAYGNSRTETLPATPWKDFLTKLSA